MREVTRITLGGATYPMRPTFEAYGEIEARFGNLRQVYTTVMMGTATGAMMAGIVKIGTDAAGEALDEAAIGHRIFDEGPFSENVIFPISEYLASIGWTPEQRKKIAADAAAKEKTPRSA